MTENYVEAFKNSDLSKTLIDRINTVCKDPVRLMEVCGTHTTTIFRHGLRSVLPENIKLLSGPGCPVCVTDQSEIDAFIELAGMNEVIIVTFGDLLRVPGGNSSLQKEQACGADVRIVYSPLDAIQIAKDNPAKRIVFPGIGFETTTPTVAASLLTAQKEKITNYSVFSAHKTVPPALDFLMGMEKVNIDGFLLPGHVSTIIGKDAYLPFYEKYHIPSAIAGFDPADILLGIVSLVADIASQNPRLVNCYKRVVSDQGNRKARKITDAVFGKSDANWRGLGRIPDSGLMIREEFAAFDARKVFDLSIQASKPINGCICGSILTGQAGPEDCDFFRTRCTPIDPVGPCMVSSEGTCAAYYKYGR